MGDHEIGETLAIDEDHFLGNGCGVVGGGAGKVTGGDEDAFVRLFASEGADEALDFLPANVGAGLVAFGLDDGQLEVSASFISEDLYQKGYTFLIFLFRFFQLNELQGEG